MTGAAVSFDELALVETDTAEEALERIQERQRPVLSKPQPMSLAGMKPDAAFALVWLSQIDGSERAREDLRSGADGSLTLVVPADNRDMVAVLRAR